MSCICACIYHLDWCHGPDRCSSQDFCLAVTVVSRRRPSIEYLFLFRIEQWMLEYFHVQLCLIFENNFLWTIYVIIEQSWMCVLSSVELVKPRYLRLLRCWCVFLISFLISFLKCRQNPDRASSIRVGWYRGLQFKKTSDFRCRTPRSFWLSAAPPMCGLVSIKKTGPV